MEFFTSPAGVGIAVAVLFLVVIFLCACVGASAGAIVDEATGDAARKRYYDERKAKGIEGSTEFHG